MFNSEIIPPENMVNNKATVFRIKSIFLNDYNLRMSLIRGDGGSSPTRQAAVGDVRRREQTTN